MKYLRATMWIVLGLFMSILMYTIPLENPDPTDKAFIKLVSTVTSMVCVFMAFIQLGWISFARKKGFVFEDTDCKCEIHQDDIHEPDKLKRVQVFQGSRFKDISKEHLTKSDFTTPVNRLGKFGGNIAAHSEVIYRCPKCDYRHHLIFEHGDVVKCECGLYAETHGNGLDVWE